MAAPSACSVAPAHSPTVPVARAVKKKVGVKRSQAVSEDEPLAEEKAKQRRVLADKHRQIAELTAELKKLRAVTESVTLALALVEKQNEEDRLDDSPSGVLERLTSRAQEMTLK